MKILQFPIANNRGGTTQYVLNNWEHIDKDQFQFDFATISKKLDFEDQLVEQGCKVHYLSCYAEDNENQFKNEMNLILSNGYDAIHLHTNCWKSFLVEELAQQNNIPKIIVHSHNTMVLENDEDRRIEAIQLHELRKSQFSIDLATDFWACSYKAANWLYGEQIPKDKIVIMKNAIDSERFQFNQDIRAIYRKKLNLENSLVIGNVGRFSYQKNQDFLIDIFKDIYKYNKKAKLLLIGVGPLEASLRKKVFDNNLEQNILFLGKRDDVPDLMQAMDVFCLPSNFEGLGMVLIEAQASGLRCIASDNVPQEVVITNDIIRIPLNREMWIDYITELSTGYDRTNNKNLIINAGYDIRNQIKIIENHYLKSDNNKNFPMNKRGDIQ